MLTPFEFSLENFNSTVFSTGFLAFMYPYVNNDTTPIIETKNKMSLDFS